MKFRIREARELVGMSQKELAESLGIKPTTFNGYETGAHDPKSDILIKIAQKCKVTVDYLLWLTDDPKGYKKSPEPERFEVSDHEKLLIMAYRASPSMQTAVDKLLGIEGVELPPNFEEIRQHANEMAKKLFKNQPTPAEK